MGTQTDAAAFIEVGKQAVCDGKVNGAKVALAMGKKGVSSGAKEAGKK